MTEHLISTAVHHMLPERSGRVEAERPRLDLDVVIRAADIPDVVVGADRACISYRFFQVEAAWMAEAQELLGVSPEENEKAKLCSDDPTEKMRLSDSFNAREETVRHNWLEQFVPEWLPAMMLEEGHIKKFMNQLVVMLQMPESSSHAEADEIVIPVIGEPAYHDRAAVATSGFSQSQALNNGLSVESLMAMANEFFWPGEKDVRKRKETVENWCATVRLHCQQLQHLLSDSPANLATFRSANVAGNPSVFHADPCAFALESTERGIKLKNATAYLCSIWRESNEQNHPLCHEVKAECFALVAGKSVDKLLEVTRSLIEGGWCACHVKEVLTMFGAVVDILHNVQGLPLNISDEVVGILRKMVVDGFSAILSGTASDVDNSEGCGIHQATVVFKQVLRFLCSNTDMVQSILATGGCTIDPCSHGFGCWERKLEEDARSICQDEKGLRNIYLLNNTYSVWQTMRRCSGASLPNVDLISRLIVMIQRDRKSFLDQSWVALITPLQAEAYLKNPRPSYLQKFSKGFDAMCRSQSTWKVTPELKYELRREIKSLLVAPYARALQKKPGRFLRVCYRCKQFTQLGKIHRDFTVEQLERNIEELYER
ncbi:hypothetical protein CFC21_102925 [Triticum aestivum]|uniref:Exocyst subunit Exo70 family protein n=2 Tax=Triticum aestivum TaxID=4565 RepID=A0A3B6BXT3_WHEAT|nr:hypothetical protein CFC21_102925 [Triticum aestivum]